LDDFLVIILFKTGRITVIIRVNIDISVLLKGCFVAGQRILDIVSSGVIGLGLAVGIVLVSSFMLEFSCGFRE